MLWSESELYHVCMWSFCNATWQLHFPPFFPLINQRCFIWCVTCLLYIYTWCVCYLATVPYKWIFFRYGLCEYLINSMIITWTKTKERICSPKYFLKKNYYGPCQHFVCLIPAKWPFKKKLLLQNESPIFQGNQGDIVTLTRYWVWWIWK